LLLSAQCLIGEPKPMLIELHGLAIKALPIQRHKSKIDPVE
jgi:hypothetical protein